MPEQQFKNLALFTSTKIVSLRRCTDYLFSRLAFTLPQVQSVQSLECRQNMDLYSDRAAPGDPSQRLVRELLS